MSILQTKDGSNTFISPIYQEAFHSRHGAITESQYVFIEMGLLEAVQKSDRPIHIFEMGFGSGLNALLTAFFSETHPDCQRVFYDTLEKHPISWDDAKQMDFCRHIQNETRCKELFENIHTSDWDQSIAIAPSFSIHKMRADLIEVSLNQEFYDLVYYDAFGPRAQPELWSQEICDKLFAIINSGGILTTYCAQGQFKRNLTQSGFQVEALPGPPGKREMTRAWKP